MCDQVLYVADNSEHLLDALCELRKLVWLEACLASIVVTSMVIRLVDAVVGDTVVVGDIVVVVVTVSVVGSIITTYTES